MTKDLKLEIWICFSSPITKHWAPLHQTPRNFPIPLPKWTIFAMLKVLDERLQIFFEFQKQMKNV
jgi:hypothetical protein